MDSARRLSQHRAGALSRCNPRSGRVLPPRDALTPRSHDPPVAWDRKYIFHGGRDRRLVTLHRCYRATLLSGRNSPRGAMYGSTCGGSCANKGAPTGAIERKLKSSWPVSASRLIRLLRIRGSANEKSGYFTILNRQLGKHIGNSLPLKINLPVVGLYCSSIQNTHVILLVAVLH